VCLCDCGNITETRASRLLAGHTLSCGCLRRITGTIHGAKHTSEYNIWNHLKQRCLTPTNHAFADYGGRGVTVCERWLSGDGVRGGFECFLEDMGPRPSRAHSIDRFPDKNGNYSIAGLDFILINSRLQKGWPLSRAILQERRARH
jgi:hypothetical protein